MLTHYKKCCPDSVEWPVCQRPTLKAMSTDASPSTGRGHFYQQVFLKELEKSKPKMYQTATGGIEAPGQSGL